MKQSHSLIGLILFIILCLTITCDCLLLGFLYPFAILNDVMDVIINKFPNLYKYAENINIITFVIPHILYLIFKIIILPIIYKKSDKSGFTFYVLEKIRLSLILKVTILVVIILLNKMLNKVFGSFILGFGGLLLSYISLLIYFFVIRQKKNKNS